jgi:NAD(P)H-flavin reductase
MDDKRTQTLIVTRVRQQAAEIRSLDVLPADADGPRPVYLPGQVAVLRLGPEGRPSYFAFASAPEDEQAEFLVKSAGAGGGSQQFYELAEGDPVELVEVAGRGFPLDAHAGKDLIFVAMGTGVAPLRSTLRHALRHAERFGQLVVLYGARTPDQFCYRDETASWQAAGVELRQVVSRPDGYEWAGQTGYVQSLLDNVLPNLSAPVALVCGSREMIDHTRDRLQEMGLAAEDILTNY